MMPNAYGEEVGSKSALPVFKTLLETLHMVLHRPSVLVPMTIGAGLFGLAVVFISNKVWTGSKEATLSEINLLAWLMLLASVLLYAWSVSTTILLVAALERKENLSLSTALGDGLKRLLPLVLNWVLVLLLLGAVCLPLLILIPTALERSLSFTPLEPLGWSLLIGTTVVFFYLLIKYGLVGPAVILGHYGPVTAFTESSRTVSSQFMRSAGLLLLLMVSGFVLNVALEQIPVVGNFIGHILTSFWATGTIALTYLRLGSQTVDTHNVGME